MNFTIQKIADSYYCQNDRNGLEIVLDGELQLKVAIKRNNDSIYEFYSPTKEEVDACVELIKSMGV